MTQRILLVTVDYAPQTGGVPLLLSRIVEATRGDADWRVVTAAPAESGHESDEVVRTHGVLGIARTAWRQRRWLRASPDRLIVSGHVYLGPLAHLIGLLTRTRVSTLAYGRELVPERLRQRLALATLKRDHRVVTISQHSSDLVNDLGVASERSSWVAPEMAPGFVEPAMPDRRGPTEPLRLITITRLAEGYKNVEVLLRAVSVLAASGRVSCLTIVGDGPRRAALQQKVEAWGLSDVVELPGQLDDSELSTRLAASHVGVFSSRHALAEGGFEGFGIVIQELAASGLPVVVGDVAGARDAARSQWALKVAPDDLRAWVLAIDRLHEDEDLRMDMATAARTWGRQLDSTDMGQAFLAELTGAG